MKRLVVTVFCSILLASAVWPAPSDTELWNLWNGFYKTDPSRWGGGTVDKWDCMDVAWVAMPYAYGAMHAYEYSGDLSWLDIASAGLDRMKQGLRKNPRGEDAFITASTQFFAAGNGFQGVDVGGESFRMILGFAHYAALVKNEPKATSAQKAKADEYLDFVKDNLWIRWNRDWWYQSDNFALIHPNAGVYRYPTYPEFTPNPALKCQTSQYNKQHEAGRINLYLWKATGDSTYWHKARRQVVNYLSKCRLRDSGTRYEWDYGNPAGPYDGGCEDKSWIEHRGGYMRLTTQYVVDCWLEGITVDQKEIDRFVTAMLTTIWNGDVTSPSFALNDGSSMGSGGPLHNFAGFDNTVAEICANSLNNTYKADKLHGLMEGIPMFLSYKKRVKERLQSGTGTVVDYNPPKVIRATAINKGKVEIEFDEEMDKASAENTANWALTRGIPVVGAVLQTGNKKVILYTGEQTTGTAYRLTINATDKSGNVFFNHMFQRPEFTANSIPLNHDGLRIRDLHTASRAAMDMVRQLGNPVSIKKLRSLLPDVILYTAEGVPVKTAGLKNAGIYYLGYHNSLEKIILVK